MLCHVTLCGKVFVPIINFKGVCFVLLNDFKLGLRKTTDPEYYKKMKKKSNI